MMNVAKTLRGTASHKKKVTRRNMNIWENKKT
jgi:hypothetical protein